MDSLMIARAHTNERTLQLPNTQTIDEAPICGLFELLMELAHKIRHQNEQIRISAHNSN